MKTRLAQDIGESAAAKVHEYLARHCLRQISNSSIAPIELWCTPDTEHDFFSSCRAEWGVSLKQQVGSDLGQRMQHALSETLRNSSYAVLMGTDCPIMSTEYLRFALSLVRQNKTVIGPAEDGGYVLLGVNEMQEQLFSNMPWGASQVYVETVKRITGDAEALTPLWDIDYVADLRRLRDEADVVTLEPEFREYLNGLNLL